MVTHIWPISEFPSETCVLLLLSLHSHITIAHCNDSNGTDTRVRVRCNDSDVMDRKQSRVCNDSTVTDMSWAIATCDGHINCWQSKVWKPQNMELPYTEWNLIAYMRQRYNVPDKEIDVFLSQYLWHAGKYKCCYRKNCDRQKNMCVAITKIVTDQSCYRYCWDGKSYINVAIVTPWRTRVDVCVTDS